MRVRSKLRSVVRRVWPPRPKPLILMYHRIADVPIDNWGLAVSAAHFEEQLQVLRRTRRPFPLTDFVRHLMAGTLPQNAVAVTFDDGYVDNLVAGKPRLVAADVPATVFLATGFLDRPGEFWWDELARIILLEDGPRNIELPIRGESIHIDLGTESTLREEGAKRAVSLAKRQAALTPIWETIRLLEDDERELIMAQLRSIYPARGQVVQGRAMTGEEARELLAGGLVTIGAHTVTHPVLSRLETAAGHREVTESKLACEALIGGPVAGFAYPYGDLNADARGAVKAAGFAFACSTQRGPASAASDVFTLPRIQVVNSGGDAFEQALRSASLLR
jgi:peptidoglycan/xylan/chitin deacetylase (PgdA/CDA1 family)